MRVIARLMLFAAGLAAVPGATAQNLAARLDDVRFPFESIHAAARLQVAARMCDPIYEPHTAAGIIAEAGGSPWSPLGCVASANAVRAREARWHDALTELQRLLDDVGDMLAPLPGENPATRSALRVRDACHMQIAALPPSVLSVYRQRVDAAAERLLQEGQSQLDPRPLQRLVRQYFCSRSGDLALDLLGGLAFERGDFDEARHWWRLLAPLNEAAADLHFPDPRGDVAAIHAKQIIAAIFRSDRDQAETELTVFARRHPGATGSLAGRTGKLVEILRTIAAETTPRIALAEAKNWNTFAGSYTRNRSNPQYPSARFWAHGFGWHGANPFAGRSAGVHPIIVDGRVLISNDRTIAGYDLGSGQMLQPYDLKGAGHADGIVEDPAIAPSERRHSLSAGDGLVCACLGIAGLELGLARERSLLVCLELAEPAATKIPEVPLALRERWHILAKGPDDAAAFFQGAPIIHDRRIYAALSWRSGKRLHTELRCYDDRGSLRWSQPIGDVFDRNDVPGHLLTIAGLNVVYCTHAGAVVAVERSTGNPVWALRYANSVEDSTSPPSAVSRNDDPRPCVHSNGRVFVAPLDCRSVFCLEANTGRILWERDRLRVLQLLGVGQGRLIMTTPDGIRGLDDKHGGDAWAQPLVGRLGTAGRGFLAAGWTFWPTQDPLLPVRSLSNAAGEQSIFRRGAAPLEIDPTQLRLIQPGNLVYTSEGMVVATERELFGYPANR